MTLRARIATRIFGDIIEEAVKAAAVSVRVDDSSGWDAHTAGPADRSWSERAVDLGDALEAWQKNFIVRRIVTLTRSYVLGTGITISSKRTRVNKWLQTWWDHPQNHMDTRLGPICDELTRAGEIFPVLFTNKVDGISYVRFVPASQIREIITDPDDYETELAYTQNTATGEPKTWIGIAHQTALNRPEDGTMPPLMLHFCINRPIGATRGESDLTPILPWAKRYSEWLKDRVRLNRQRTRQGLLDIEIADDSQVRDKRQQLRTSNPIEAGIYVHGPGEKVVMHNLEIRADEAADDGHVLRLAIAAGANVGLHYLGEGERVNYATAKEMGEPTARHYTERQHQLIDVLTTLITVAYWRYNAQTRRPVRTDEDLQLVVSAAEVARADNMSLARAAILIVRALGLMRDRGWITDERAIELAFKFAGEPLSAEQIDAILAEVDPLPPDNGDGRSSSSTRSTSTPSPYSQVRTLQEWSQQ